MQTLAEIDAAIAPLRAQLRKLRAKRKALVAKRREARKPRDREMLRLFDDERLGFVQIANKMGLPTTLVRQFLWSRGRTVRGRLAIRSQMIISGAQHPAPAPAVGAASPGADSPLATQSLPAGT